MKFTINREQFLKGLMISAKAIGSKSPIPVMANVKIKISEKGLELTGSNSELTIQTTIPYSLEGNEIIRDASYGETLVANKFITEIVRRLEGDEVTFEVVDDTIAKISDGKSDFKLNSVKAEEYPDIDLEMTGAKIQIAYKEFKELVDQTAFAASTRDQRPILTALNLESIEGELTATATDSARLSKKSIHLNEKISFIANVPATVMSEVAHLLEEEDAMVTLAISEKKVVFALNGTLVTTRLVNGEYPNTRHIIPHGFSYFLEANSQELIAAMERVSLLSVDRENVVKITMTEDSVEISAKSSQIGSATEKISTFQYTGERLEVSFNSTYVMQAIKAAKCEDVTIAFLGEMKPFVIKNVKNESHVQLVTPVRTY